MKDAVDRVVADAEHIEVSHGHVVELFQLGTLWHWELRIDGARQGSGAADDRDSALFWAGWWSAREQIRRDLAAGKAVR